MVMGKSLSESRFTKRLRCLATSGRSRNPSASTISAAAAIEVKSWLPMTRYPEHLYKVYLGHTEELSAGARESAKYDLLALAVPKGLDLDGFGVSVAASLLQMPVVHRIDQFLAQPRSFGAVRDFLGALPQYPQHRDPSADWQTMMRWFRHFLPQRFHVSVPNYSEVTFRVG